MKINRQVGEIVLALGVVSAAFYGIKVLAQPPIPEVVVVPDTHSVALAWDPSPDAGIGSYRVHWGTNSGGYTSVTNVGNVTQATIHGLEYGVTNFFAVTAVGTNQLESEFSNEISYAPGPRAPELRLPQMLQVEVTYEGRGDGGWEILGRETVNIQTEKSYGLFRARVSAKQVDMLTW